MPVPQKVLAACDALASRLLTPVYTAVAAGTRLEPEPSQVIGVGVGLAGQGHEPSGQFGLQVYVTDERAAETVPQAEDGVEVQINVVGAAHAAALGRLLPPRPIAGGVSISHPNAPAGTLGCLVRNGTATYILSNNHVLACSNNARVGDAVIHPASDDGGDLTQDICAHLAHWQPLDFTSGTNEVDAALASPQTDGDIAPFILGLGEIRGCADLDSLPNGGIGLRVRKTGRTTHYTEGIIQARYVRIKVEYPGYRVAEFINQIIVRPIDANGSSFADFGDSGAMVLDQAHHAVGLLFAVSKAEPRVAWLNPATVIERVMGVKLYTMHPAP